eukprot:2197793-Amphidinium_carterae.1
MRDKHYKAWFDANVRTLAAHLHNAASQCSVPACPSGPALLESRCAQANIKCSGLQSAPIGMLEPQVYSQTIYSKPFVQKTDHNNKPLDSHNGLHERSNTVRTVASGWWDGSTGSASPGNLLNIKRTCARVQASNSTSPLLAAQESVPIHTFDERHSVGHDQSEAS